MQPRSDYEFFEVRRDTECKDSVPIFTLQRTSYRYCTGLDVTIPSVLAIAPVTESVSTIEGERATY